MVITNLSFFNEKLFETEQEDFLKENDIDHIFQDFILNQTPQPILRLPSKEKSIFFNPKLNCNSITILTKNRESFQDDWVVLPFCQTISTICTDTGLERGFGKYIRAAVLCYMTQHYNPVDFYGNMEYDLRDLKILYNRNFGNKTSLKEELYVSGIKYMSNYNFKFSLNFSSSDITLINPNDIHKRYPLIKKLENNSDNFYMILDLCKNLFPDVFSKI